MMRKRMSFWFIGVLLVMGGALGLAGCATFQQNYGMIDKTVPLNRQCFFYVPADFEVSSFDGKKAVWMKGSVVLLPEGRHTIECRIAEFYRTSDGAYETTYSRTSGWEEITYDFIAGHNYTLDNYVIRQGDADTTYDDNSRTTTRAGTVGLGVAEMAGDAIKAKITDRWYIGADGALNIYTQFTSLAFSKTEDVWLDGGWTPTTRYEPVPYSTLAGLELQQGASFISNGIHLDVLAEAGAGFGMFYYPLERDPPFNIGLFGDWHIGVLATFYPVNALGIGAGAGLFGGSQPGGENGKRLPYIRGAVSFKRSTKFGLYFDYFLEDPQNDFFSFNVGLRFIPWNILGR